MRSVCLETDGTFLVFVLCIRDNKPKNMNKVNGNKSTELCSFALRPSVMVFAFFSLQSLATFWHFVKNRCVHFVTHLRESECASFVGFCSFNTFHVWWTLCTYWTKEMNRFSKQRRMICKIVHKSAAIG